MQSLLAIADPTRRRIVELLAERERTSGELVEEFDMSAPAISQHLNVLREAGLVVTRAEGQSRIQSLNPHGFDEVEAWLEKTRSIWSSRLDALEHALRAEDVKNAAVAKKTKTKKRSSKASSLKPTKITPSSAAPQSSGSCARCPARSNVFGSTSPIL